MTGPARRLIRSRLGVVEIRLGAGQERVNESLAEKEACLPVRKCRGKAGEFHSFCSWFRMVDFTGNKKFLLTISAS